MTRALAMPGALGERPFAPVPPLGEDRWFRRERGRKELVGATALVLAGSLLLHGLLLAIALRNDPLVQRRSPEPVAVDLVQDIPESARPKQAKADQAAKAERQRVEEQMTEAKAPPPQLRPAQPVPPAAPEKAVLPSPPNRPSASEQDADLRDLRAELAKLKAEQAVLRRAEAAEDQAVRPIARAAASSPVGKAAASEALGLLPSSFQAVALPSDTSGQGEATDYAELVFSQLAKAKGIGREEGHPGTAGVRFTIDGQGHLTDVELVTSSGIKALDDKALAVVRKAAPFPAPPRGAQRSFSANVSFVADTGAP